FANLVRTLLAVQFRRNPVKKALILDAQREIERLKNVVAESNQLLAQSREVLSTSRHFLAMLEHDRDPRILSRNATGWTRSRGSEFETPLGAAPAWLAPRNSVGAGVSPRGAGRRSRRTATWTVKNQNRQRLMRP